MTAQDDAERDAVALIQAAPDGDGEAAVVILGQCDLPQTCAVLSAVAAYLVRLLGPQNEQMLMGGLRKAAYGLPVRLVSDGHRITEEATRAGPASASSSERQPQPGGAATIQACRNVRQAALANGWLVGCSDP